MTEIDYTLKPIGFIRSELTNRHGAPMQGYEGAPDAWIDVDPAYIHALDGLAAGDAVILITWLHQSDRSVMKVHPRSDPDQRLRGVFSTRSPDRPNPLGLHRVTVYEVDGLHLKVGPLEAIDGTPVVDVKPVLNRSADA